MHNQNQPSSTLGRIRLFGNRDSAEAWQIRDFLKRSAVEFDWVELTGDTDCQNMSVCRSSSCPRASAFTARP
jgi:hypothetical protein